MADIGKILQENAAKFDFINGDTADKLKSTLKELGYNFIVDEAKNPEYVPKARLDDELQKKELFKTQLEQQSATMKELEKAAGDKTKVEELLAAEKGKAEALDKQLQDLSLNSAIKLKVAAGDYMAHDPNDILTMIKKENLKLNGETVEGLDEQLKTLKETKAYLFTAVTKPPVGAGSNPGGAPGAAAPGQQQDLRSAIAAQLAL